MAAIGVPVKMFKPRSLRGGGTVWLFEHTNNLGLTLWRGRWQSERSISWYLQEALGYSSLSRLPRSVQHRIQHLDSVCEELCRVG